MVWALRATTLKKKILLPYAAAFAASVYGITDEFHQTFVPGRNADLFDWFMDIIGAVVGAFVSVKLIHILRKERI